MDAVLLEIFLQALHTGYAVIAVRGITDKLVVELADTTAVCHAETGSQHSFYRIEVEQLTDDAGSDHRTEDSRFAAWVMFLYFSTSST